MAENSDGYDQQEATVYEHIVAGQYLLKQQDPRAAKQCFDAAIAAWLHARQAQLWTICTETLGTHEEVSKRILQDAIVTAYERLPTFRSGHSVWDWLESIVQEHILVEALQEVQSVWITEVGQADGPDICQEVWLTASEKLPTIPRGPGLRRWLRRIARYKIMQYRRDQKIRGGLREKNGTTIRVTTHAQQMPTPTQWLDALSWLRGKQWSTAMQACLEQVYGCEWTCTEVALALLINSPRTPQRFRRKLEAIQTLLVEVDREENQPTLLDKKQKRLVDDELEHASRPAKKLWKDTWQRVTGYVKQHRDYLERKDSPQSNRNSQVSVRLGNSSVSNIAGSAVKASAIQLQRERTDETRKFL